MVYVRSKRLVLLSGPSCVGKGPLKEAIKTFYSKTSDISRLLTNDPIPFKEIDVIKSFKSRKIDESLQRSEKIKMLRPEDSAELFEDSATLESWKERVDEYIFGYCRGNPQAISLKLLESAFKNSDTIYLEAYYTLGEQVLNHPLIKRIPGLSVTTIFLSPLSPAEIRALNEEKVDMKKYLTYLMMRKMLDRDQAMGKTLTDAVLADDRSRSEDAWTELSFAHKFGILMWNHDGQSHKNWHMKEDVKPPYFLCAPEGDAAICAQSFAKILGTDQLKDLPINCTRLTEPLFK